MPAQVRQRSLLGIEPQVGLALIGVRPMTVKTLVGQDGPNVAVKVDLGSTAAARCGQQAKQCE